MTEDHSSKNDVIPNQVRSLSAVDIVIILLKRKRIILITTVIIMILSIIVFFFVADLIYFSSASVKNSGKSGGLLSSLEGLSDFGGLDELGGSKSSKELTLYKEILSSRRCLEPIILEYGLMKRDDIQFMEDAVKYFQKEKMVVEIDKLSGIMSIGIYDKDPVLAKKIVESLLQQLDKINIEMNVQTAKDNRMFIENRYIGARNDLKNAEDSLKSFQSIYGIAPELQVKAAVQSVFALQSELKSEEVRLEIMEKLLNGDQPEVKLQKDKITSLHNKIEEMKNSTDENDYLSLGNSPNIVMSFLRLQREIELQGKIVTYLLPLYEQAKIEEKRETPTVLVLDRPFIAEKKTKPKRLTMVVICMLAGLISISMVVLVHDTYYVSFIRKINDSK